MVSLEELRERRRVAIRVRTAVMDWATVSAMPPRTCLVSRAGVSGMGYGFGI